MGSRAAALPRAPGQVAGLLPALPHPAKIAAGGTIPSTARPHVRAPPPSLQCLVRSQATIHPLDGDDRKPSHLSAPPVAVTQPCLQARAPRHSGAQGGPKGDGVPELPQQQRLLPAALPGDRAHSGGAASGWKDFRGDLVRGGQCLQGKHMRQASRAGKHLPGALINKATPAKRALF